MLPCSNWVQLENKLNWYIEEIKFTRDFIASTENAGTRLMRMSQYEQPKRAKHSNWIMIKKKPQVYEERNWIREPNFTLVNRYKHCLSRATKNLVAIGEEQQQAAAAAATIVT